MGKGQRARLIDAKQKKEESENDSLVREVGNALICLQRLQGIAPKAMLPKFQTRKKLELDNLLTCSHAGKCSLFLAKYMYIVEGLG